MSIFKKVVETHERAKLAAAEAAATAATAKSTAAKTFHEVFGEQIEAVAKPIFQQFVLDAIELGYEAKIEYDKANVKPFIVIKLIPVKGVAFSSNASDECVYSVRGLVAEEKVQYTSYFDQRPGKQGKKQSEFGIQSIRKEHLESELEAFLKATLDARDS